MKLLIQEKKKFFNTYLTTRTNQTYQSYKIKNRELRHKIKEERNQQWEQCCNRIESLIGGSQSTEVWRTVKTMKTNNRDKSNQLITLKEWKDHYNTFLTETREEFKEPELGINVTEQLEQLTTDEVKQCIKEMKSGRSPGPGNIAVELIKCGGTALVDRIAKLMNTCLQQQRIPLEWKTSHMVALYKKGDRRDPNSYRGLSINCTFSRLFGKIIQKRLRQNIGHKIGEDQSGFTPGRSCTDNLFTIQQLLEKKIAKEDEVHIAFIDLLKAYDNVPRNKLWIALQALGTHPHLIKIIQEYYENNVAYAKQGGRLSEPINTTKGLRQGCSLSPLLFNIYVEMALKNWKRSCEGMGIPINQTHLFTLSFADDQAVFAQDAYDLEFMLRRLYEEYAKWGLQISLTNTEYLVVNSNAKFDVLLNDDSQVKQVTEFKYLGVSVDSNGIGKREINQRIQKARQVLGALNAIWWDNNITKKTKKRIGQVLVETVLCYGSEIWTMREDDKRKVRAVEMDYLRRSSRVSRRERITNDEIRNRMAAIETVTQRIEKRSLKWFGHLLRMEDGRWPKRLFTWKPPGKNKRGRPRKSWNEGIRAAMRDRDLDEQLAYDREAWRLGVGMRHLAV